MGCVLRAAQVASRGFVNLPPKSAAAHTVSAVQQAVQRAAGVCPSPRAWMTMHVLASAQVSNPMHCMCSQSCSVHSVHDESQVFAKRYPAVHRFFCTDVTTECAFTPGVHDWGVPHFCVRIAPDVILPVCCARNLILQCSRAYLPFVMRF